MSDLSFEKKILSLILTCRILHNKDIAGWWLDDDGYESNHWTATRDVMIEELGRPLTPEEIAVLSISRAYGPVPVLSDGEVARVYSYLWPNGNSRGLRREWEGLANELSELIEIV